MGLPCNIALRDANDPTGGTNCRMFTLHCRALARPKPLAIAVGTKSKGATAESLWLQSGQPDARCEPTASSQQPAVDCWLLVRELANESLYFELLLMLLGLCANLWMQRKFRTPKYFGPQKATLDRQVFAVARVARVKTQDCSAVCLHLKQADLFPSELLNPS